MRDRSRKLNKTVFLSIILSVIFLLAACGNNGSNASVSEGENSSEPAAKETGIKSNISIGTHQPGVAFYTAGAGIASVVTENSPVKVTVRPFQGVRAWAPLLDSGEVDLGMGSYPSSDIFYGRNGYDRHKNVRTMVLGNQIQMVGFSVLEDSEINSIKDLKGKKVAFPTTDSETIQNLFKVQLNSVGLTLDDVEKVPVSGIKQGIDALREGRVDSAFAGDPNVGMFLEADNAVGIKGLNLGDISPENFDQFPQEFRDKMNEIIPGLEPVVAEDGFLNNPTVIYQYPVVLYGSAHLSDETAYEVTKTLFENYEKLKPIFGWFKTWSPEIMFRPDPPAPYHPGAIKYFKEQGIWTEEAEKNQQELMKLAE